MATMMEAESRQTASIAGAMEMPRRLRIVEEMRQMPPDELAKHEEWIAKEIDRQLGPIREHQRAADQRLSVLEVRSESAMSWRGEVSEKLDLLLTKIGYLDGRTDRHDYQLPTPSTPKPDAWWNDRGVIVLMGALVLFGLTIAGMLVAIAMHKGETLHEIIAPALTP